jgi:hypothetical protein
MSKSKLDSALGVVWIVSVVVSSAACGLAIAGRIPALFIVAVPLSIWGAYPLMLASRKWGNGRA